MSQVHCNDVPQHNSNHCGEPHKTSAHNPDVDPIPSSPQDIPPEAEGVRGQRNKTLSLDEEEGEIVGQMVTYGDGDKGKYEGLCECFRGEAPAASRGHDCAKRQIDAYKQHRKGDETQGLDGGEALSAQVRQDRVEGALDVHPCRSGHESVKGHCREDQQREGHHRVGDRLVP